MRETAKLHNSLTAAASPALCIRMKQIAEKKSRIELLFQYLIDLLLCFIEHVSTLSSRHHRKV